MKTDHASLAAFLLVVVGCGGSASEPISADGGHGAAPAHDGGAPADAHATVDAHSSADANTHDGAAVPNDGGGTTCSGTATANACVTCCATAHRQGANDITLVGYECMCSDCSDACKQSVCMSTAEPQGECIACVKSSLASVCPGNTAFAQHCAGDCTAYVACVEACPSN